ncbi:MAG: hypothetical protein KDA92_09735 [Planctomycetales bacterium]|nr:hypothetical protein [Planctomycetales bacterium]
MRASSETHGRFSIMAMTVLRVIVLLAAWTSSLTLGGLRHACAQAADPEVVYSEEDEEEYQEEYDTGRYVLESGDDLPWYDAENDRLRPLPAPPTKELRQSSEWEWKTKAKKNTSSGGSFAGFWEAFWRVVQWLVWLALIAIFITFIYYWIAAVAERRKWEQGGEAEEITRRREADLIEQLPFQVKRPTLDLLSEARHAYQTGDYAAAIVYLFSYQLVQLDQSHRIRLSKGKTNRQYLFELRSEPRLREILAETVLVFEDVYFGHYELHRERFDACWNQLDEFERLVRVSAVQLGTASQVATLLLIAICCLTAVGCGKSEKLSTRYGRARGAGSQSINGLSVFAGMYEQVGCQVTTWRRLSPKLDRQQVIVWAPDRYTPPTSTEINYLNNWLSVPGRTLVYIGRDYDGATDYWRDVLPLTAADERLGVRNEAARAAAADEDRRERLSESATCTWFDIESDQDVPPPHRLAGPWADSIDAQNVELVVNRRWQLPNIDEDTDWGGSLQSTALLTADDRLVLGRLTRDTWEDSQILIVPNGSWLLNSRLVNREHRRLAQQVIDESWTLDRVCFLESDDQELVVSDRDTNPPLILQMFTVYPANVLMLHVVFLGMLYCISVYPIFGLPKTLPPDEVSDFGKHVTAVGELLEKGRDRSYARALVDQYREKIANRDKTKPTN